jgi:hypothetical protein
MCRTTYLHGSAVLRRICRLGRAPQNMTPTGRKWMTRLPAIRAKTRRSQKPSLESLVCPNKSLLHRHLSLPQSSSASRFYGRCSRVLHFEPVVRVLVARDSPCATSGHCRHSRDGRLWNRERRNDRHGLTSRRGYAFAGGRGSRNQHSPPCGPAVCTENQILQYW